MNYEQLFFDCLPSCSSTVYSVVLRLFTREQRPLAPTSRSNPNQTKARSTRCEQLKKGWKIVSPRLTSVSTPQKNKNVGTKLKLIMIQENTKKMNPRTASAPKL